MVFTGSWHRVAAAPPGGECRSAERWSVMTRTHERGDANRFPLTSSPAAVAAMKSLLLGILALILALVIAGTVALAAVNLGVDREATKNHSVFGAVREIVVKPGRGDVQFIAAGRLLRIREMQHYVFSEPTLERTRRNGVLTIETDCGDLHGAVPCYSDLRVSVPPGVKLTVDAGAGDVDVRGVDVRATHVQTGSGDIEFALADQPGLLYAHSRSGDIELLARDARAIDARTDSGDIEVDVATKPRRVKARSDSGDIELTLPRGIYAVTAKAASGDVRVRGIARNRRSPSSIDARTNSGDIELRPR